MGESGHGRNYPYGDVVDRVPRRSVAQHPAVLVLLIAGIAGLMYLAYRSSAADDAKASISSMQEVADQEDSGTPNEVTASSEDGSPSQPTPDEASDGEAAAPVVIDLGPSAALPPPTFGPYVSARLNIDAEPGNGLMVLTGRVPDQQLADLVLAAAERSYAPFVESEIEVDATLRSEPWLAVAPQIIGLLPSVTDGTIMVAEEKILLSARSPNDQYLATLQQGLDLLGAWLPVEVVDAKITDLEPPLFAVEADSGTIRLHGNVPSAETVELLVSGAAAAYGPENVINELTVDPGTYRSFWMLTMPGVFELFRVFPDYEFTVEDGRFSGRIEGGIEFAANSTEISDAAAQALNVGVAVLARDVSVGMVVVGHTDSQGPEDYNQALSLARAESVIEYFTAAGIDPVRMQAHGAGEAEPIADNATEEGRLRNRRVEFRFGPLDSLGAG